MIKIRIEAHIPTDNNSMAKEYPLNQKTTSKPSNTIPLNHKFEIDRHHLPNNPGPASNKSNNWFGTIAIFR